jgi:hypothetical protein
VLVGDAEDINEINKGTRASEELKEEAEGKWFTSII